MNTKYVLFIFGMILMTSQLNASSLSPGAEEENANKLADEAELLNELIEEKGDHQLNDKQDKPQQSQSSDSQRVSEILRLAPKNLIDPFLKKLLRSYQYSLEAAAQTPYGDSNSDESSIENTDADIENDFRHQIDEISKRSSQNLTKKDVRRHQVSRWDIGYGKRASSGKSKAFMDAMYGKRSNVATGQKQLPKTSFGRRQQWDLQYGRK